jgi:hypothetical protein
MEEASMLRSMTSLLGLGKKPTELDKFEPIYGLPKRSLDEWLSRNPQLKKDYDEELAARLQRSRAIGKTSL